MKMYGCFDKSYERLGMPRISGQTTAECPQTRGSDSAQWRPAASLAADDKPCVLAYYTFARRRLCQRALIMQEPVGRAPSFLVVGSEF